MRSNDAEVDRVLRQLLADHLVDDPAAPVNFSVRVADPSHQGRSQSLHLLYHGHHVVARSRSLSRLVRSLLGHLSGSAWDLRERTDLLRLHVAGFARDGSAILVPFHLGLRLEARLAAQGFGSVAGSWVAVDPHTAELVVDEPQLTIDAAVLRDLTDRWPPSPHERPAAGVGRYDLRLWVLDEVTADHPPEPALHLVSAAKAMVGVDRAEAGQALQAMARLVEATPVMPAEPVEDLMAAARVVADPARRSRS